MERRADTCHGPRRRPHRYTDAPPPDRSSAGRRGEWSSMVEGVVGSAGYFMAMVVSPSTVTWAFIFEKVTSPMPLTRLRWAGFWKRRFSR